MKKTQLKSKIKIYFLNFFLAQIVATIISLPILINWGMPISAMSIAGNFLFSPLMTMFLVLSSFIFFTELLGIPNYLFTFLLNKLTIILEYCLSLGSKNWLINFPMPKYKILLLIIPFIASYILISKKIKLLKIKIGILMIFLTFSFFLLKNFNRLEAKQLIIGESLKNQLIIKQNQNKTLEITDFGHFNKKISTETYVSMEITPFLIKNFGSKTINQLLILNPTSRSFKAAIELNKIFNIDEIQINLNNKKLSKTSWRWFYILKKYSKENKIKLAKQKMLIS